MHRAQVYCTLYYSSREVDLKRLTFESTLQDLTEIFRSQLLILKIVSRIPFWALMWLLVTLGNNPLRFLHSQNVENVILINKNKREKRALD
jgi:hypothetical protein